jgi:hypothetical protein
MGQAALKLGIGFEKAELAPVIHLQETVVELYKTDISPRNNARRNELFLY